MTKKGFTLVEIMVVTAIFAILMIVGTNIIIQVIQSSRKAQIENELHQNLSLAFENISRQVRKAACMRVSNNYTILELSDSSTCSSIYATFNISASSVSVSPGGTLTSNTVTLDHTGEGNGSLSPNDTPTFFELLNGDKTVKVSISLKSNSPSTRWDFNGSQIATESVSIRQFSL